MSSTLSSDVLLTSLAMWGLAWLVGTLIGWGLTQNILGTFVGIGLAAFVGALAVGIILAEADP